MNVFDLCRKSYDQTSTCTYISEKEELSHLREKIRKIETEQKEAIPTNIRGILLYHLLWYVISWQKKTSNDNR